MASLHLRTSHRFLALTFASLGSLTSATLGQDETYDIDRIIAPDANVNDEFGNAIALDGKDLLVGAWKDDDGTGVETGSVYVYRSTATGWRMLQELRGSGTRHLDRFGSSVALAGDLAVVGAIGVSKLRGAAYVFRRTGTTWIEEQKLWDSNGIQWDHFGADVATDGNIVAVAVTENGAPGRVCIYRHNGTSWVQTEQISGFETNSFGTSIALSGNRLLVGDPVAPVNGMVAGAAFVYRWTGSSWNFEAKLVPQTSWDGNLFGSDVDLDGTRALVGSRGRGVGACYTFDFDGTAWSETDLFFSFSASGIGTSVDLQGDRAVAGAPFGYNAYAFLYQSDTRTFGHVCRFTNNFNQIYDKNGSSVATDGTIALSGAPTYRVGGEQQGAVYVYNVLDLNQGTSEAEVNPGDPFSLLTYGGSEADLAVTFLVDVSGTPTFIKLFSGIFDSNKIHSKRVWTPSGLSGLSMDFQTIGFTTPNKLGISDAVTVTFL